MALEQIVDSPGMADRAIGPHGLIFLVDGMVSPCQEKKISPPVLSNVYERHVLCRPWIQPIEIVRAAHQPFLDIADDVFRRNGRGQPTLGQAFTQREDFPEFQLRKRLPPALTHVLAQALGNGQWALVWTPGFSS